MLDKVNLGAALEQVEGHWNPLTIGSYNGDHVQVMKVEGEFVWHHHDRTDDFFLVIEGNVVMQLREGDIELGPGELIVVPAGTEHCMRAVGEARVLVIEHLGDVGAEGADAVLDPPTLQL